MQIVVAVLDSTDLICLGFEQHLSSVANDLIGELVQRLDAAPVLAAQRRQLEDPVVHQPRTHAAFHRDLADPVQTLDVHLRLLGRPRLLAHRGLCRRPTNASLSGEFGGQIEREITANDVKGGLGHDGEDVDGLVGLLVHHPVQVVDQLFALFVEDVEEAGQDLEVEGRSQQLPAGLPSRTCPSPSSTFNSFQSN